MAITLADYAKLASDPLSKGFIMDLLRESDLMNVVPWETVDGLQVTGSRWTTIPSASFRKLNSGYTESTGTTEEIAETLTGLGGDVVIDRFFTKTGARRQTPLEVAMQMKAKSVAFKFTDQFINGDAGVDPDGFDGLKKRVANMPSRQTIDLAVAGDSLKVLASSANEQTWIDAIHIAVKRVNGATHIFANEDVYLGLGQVARRLNLYQNITDAYGRTWGSISSGSAQLPFVDVGLKSDKSTEIITNTEDPGDAGNDSTSVYVVRMDTSDGLHGIQLQGTGPEAYDPLEGGEMESKPSYMRRIDWGVGLFNLSQYSIVRIKGFKMAAS